MFDFQTSKAICATWLALLGVTVALESSPSPRAKPASVAWMLGSVECEEFVCEFGHEAPVEDPDDTPPIPYEPEFVRDPEHLLPPVELIEIDQPVRPSVEQFVHSENVESKALAWLAAHQRDDGSWSFDHRTATCVGRCSHPGWMGKSRVMATSLVLLAFAASHLDHRTGSYRANLDHGLRYLLHEQRADGGFDDSGGMASHALATWALAEYFARTRDAKLAIRAQRAIDFSVAAQNPARGGWDDTWTFGWQLQALKAGHMAWLKVPPQSIRLCSTYLDSVQGPPGRYGFRGRSSTRDDTTALGLAARITLGASYEDEAVKQGVEALAAAGPSSRNLLATYFGTEVIHAIGGEERKQWSNKLRARLVASQEHSGHAAGSWLAEGDPAFRAGGRVYATAMNHLTNRILLDKWLRGKARRKPPTDDFKL